jgi:hypothetical protein
VPCGALVISNDWTYYQECLAGGKPEIHADFPQPGYYRARLKKDGPMLPIAIYELGIDTQGNSIMTCDVGYYDGDQENGLWRRRDPCDIWTWCADKPIHYQDWLAVCKTHRWARERDPSIDVLTQALEIAATSDDGGELEDWWRKLEETRKNENAIHLDGKRMVDVKFKAAQEAIKERMKVLKREREAA